VKLEQFLGASKMDKIHFLRAFQTYPIAL